MAKGTPRRAGGGVGSSTSGPLLGGTVPGSVRSSVSTLPINSNIRRGDPVRASGGPPTARGRSPARTTPGGGSGPVRSTTPRTGGNGGSVIINGVPTTSARPQHVVRQLPTNGGSSSRSPMREGSRGGCVGGGGYPPASLAPMSSSDSPYRDVSPPPVSGGSVATNRAKFCTECGAKILSATQKFCGECGNRVADM